MRRFADESLHASLLPSHECNASDERYSLPEKHPHRGLSARYLRWLYMIKQVLLYSFALLGLASLILSLKRGLRTQIRFPVTFDSDYTAQYTNPPCYCGETVLEAINMGCVYDELSVGWMPSHCRDGELTAEFASLGDNPAGGWMYWADKNHTQPLSLAEVSQYADIQPENFHMSHEWHRQHCFFLWRKEHRMKARNKVYDPRSDSEHHIVHCIHVLSSLANGTAAGATLIG